MTERRLFSDNKAPLGVEGTALNARFGAISGIVRSAVLADLEQCRKSREQVAAEISEMTGHAVSVHMIDAYIAETKPHKFPVELVPAWVVVTGSRRLLEVLCGAVGLGVATEEDRSFAELGRVRLRNDALTARLMERA